MSAILKSVFRPGRRSIGPASLLAFVACVPLANWMVLNVGMACSPSGPCLVPVWPGVWAPSGVLLAGISFVLRDLVQEVLGIRWALFAIVIGGAVSALVATPALALASISAFLVAETADMLVYTALRRRGLFKASVASSTVGLVLDSMIFLRVAFGSVEFVSGQILGKTWMMLACTPILVLLRRR